MALTQNAQSGNMVAKRHRPRGSSVDRLPGKDDYQYKIGKHREILLDIGNKFDINDELIDIQDDMDKILKNVRIKSAEYITLEALALYSDDENIIEARNQLMFLTKMIYGDLVTEFSREYAENTDAEDETSYGDCTPETTDGRPFSPRGLVRLFFDNIYRLTRNVKTRKKMLKKLEKHR